MWIFKVHCGLFLNIVAHYGYLASSLLIVGGHGSLWILVTHFGLLHLILALCCSLGLIMVHCGLLWLIIAYWRSLDLVVVYDCSFYVTVAIVALKAYGGSFWLNMALGDSLLFILGHFGSSWFIVAHEGSLWLIVAHDYSFLVIVTKCSLLSSLLVIIAPRCGSLWL